MTSGGNNFNHSAESQFGARDAGDFSDAAGERETAPKCGSLPRDAGDLVGLFNCWPMLRRTDNENSNFTDSRPIC